MGSIDSNSTDNMCPRLVLMGPPGVGKGTQAKLLADRLGIKTISSGVIFRQEIEAQTDLGNLAADYISRGELVPNGVTIAMMKKRIQSEQARACGFLLDGFPRTFRQAEGLDEMLHDMDESLTKVIELQLDEAILLQRLSGRLGCTKCGEIYHSVSKPPKREGLCDKCNSPLFVRSDDKPEAIRQRLHVFENTIEPLRNYYTRQGLLAIIKGEEDPEMVYREILEQCT